MNKALCHQNVVHCGACPFRELYRKYCSKQLPVWDRTSVVFAVIFVLIIIIAISYQNVVWTGYIP